MGEGHVVKGLEDAIMTMRKGQKATVSIPPELAWGARGHGKVPPHSWMIVDVEILEWLVRPMNDEL